MAAENGSQIVTEKLHKNNFPAWKFRMTNFLMGKGYWEHIEEAPKIPEENTIVAQIKAFKDWNQGARKVLDQLSLTISDLMLGHIQDVVLLEEAWDSLVKLFAVNTKTRKLELKT